MIVCPVASLRVSCFQVVRLFVRLFVRVFVRLAVCAVGFPLRLCVSLCVRSSVRLFVCTVFRCWLFVVRCVLLVVW